MPRPGELLANRDITVPTTFTVAQLRRLRETRDARLAQAAARAQDGQVIQFLAGAPELLARYRNAPPAAVALIHAAMDARRLGMRVGLPRTLLEAAAPGYLTGTEWDALGDDWLKQALAYTAVPCKGVRGPLTRIRPRPASSRAPGPGSRDSDEQLAGAPAGSPGAPLYRLADYLDQYGRYHWMGQFPPAGFLAAAADHGLDWKTALEELTAVGLGVPEYQVEESGPDHHKSFRAVVRVAGVVLGSGQGRSMKEAQQHAAEEAWTSITATFAASQ